MVGSHSSGDDGRAHVTHVWFFFGRCRRSCILHRWIVVVFSGKRLDIAIDTWNSSAGGSVHLAGGSGSSASDGGSITIASGSMLVAHHSLQGLSLCQVLMQDRVELAETSL